MRKPMFFERDVARAVILSETDSARSILYYYDNLRKHVILRHRRHSARLMRAKMKERRHSPEFPMCMRFSSLEEREKFYTEEFDLRSVKEWTKHHPSIVFAVILGRYTHIFPREYARIAKHTVMIDDYDDLSDLKEFILQYRPEGAYYDRNVYSKKEMCVDCMKGDSGCWTCDNFLGQELAFDMDVENVECPLHGDLDQRMGRNDQLSFCEFDLFKLRGNAVDLIDELKTEFRKLKVTYSGRGFHIHIFDENAYRMTRKERGELADQIVKNFPIDEWVTEGESHLIRLPFSLNAIVSRIVLPLEIKELDRFDPVTDCRCIPDFLNAAVTVNRV
jgi:DNA primase catalytic subunit